jgi:hypothetical protein
MELEFIEYLPGTFENEVFLLNRVIYDGYGKASNICMIVTDKNKTVNQELQEAIDFVLSVIKTPDYSIVFVEVPLTSVNILDFDKQDSRDDEYIASPISGKDCMIHACFTINPKYLNLDSLYSQLNPKFIENGIGFKKGTMADIRPSTTWC